MLRSLYDAMTVGNAETVGAHYSDMLGSDLLGSDDPASPGPATQDGDLRRFLRNGTGAHSWRIGKAVALQEGRVGWTKDHPVLTLPGGIEVLPTLTLIWHREGVAWKVVHSHVSLETD